MAPSRNSPANPRQSAKPRDKARRQASTREERCQRPHPALWRDNGDLARGTNLGSCLDRRRYLGLSHATYN
eukprot:3825946-Amphidinium_carterae.1